MSDRSKPLFGSGKARIFLAGVLVVAVLVVLFSITGFLRSRETPPVLSGPRTSTRPSR